MKQIKTTDGKITFLAYDFNDLPEKSKEKVIADWVQFEIEVMDEDSPYYYLAEEMDKMQTPWFLAQVIFEKHKEDIIETVLVNEYLFDINGDMIGITHYTGKHPKSGQHSWKFHGQDLPVTIEEFTEAV